MNAAIHFADDPEPTEDPEGDDPWGEIIEVLLSAVHPTVAKLPKP